MDMNNTDMTTARNSREGQTWKEIKLDMKSYSCSIWNWNGEKRQKGIEHLTKLYISHLPGMGNTQVFVEALAGAENVMLEGAGVELFQAGTKAILGKPSVKLGTAWEVGVGR
jgi:hypothetical protein